jgi:ferredoxin
MPTIEFESEHHVWSGRSPLGRDVTLKTGAGVRLLDVCDDAHAPVRFSCRSARCGTCRVEVLVGRALLAPPAQDEEELLELLAAPRTQRLACQAVVRASEGLIRLRWIGNE